MVLKLPMHSVMHGVKRTGGQYPSVVQCMAINMPKKRDDDSGRYTQSVDDDDILAYLREQDGAGTSEVADAFDYEQSTVYRRMKRLEDDGRVSRREVGGVILWSVTDE
ncbi:transcriptional regulator [halophilic archaeon]|nr:transcriptional regulator [halophilic archaeon]